MVELEDVKRSFHCPNEAGVIRVLETSVRVPFQDIGVHNSSIGHLQGFWKGFWVQGFETPNPY